METTRRFQTKGDAVPDSVQPIHKHIEQSPPTSKSDSIQYTLCPIGPIGPDWFDVLKMRIGTTDNMVFAHFTWIEMKKIDFALPYSIAHF